VALLLRETDVERVVDMATVMDAVEAAMLDLGLGNAQNQPRRRVFPPGGVLNVMFASWPAGGVSGLKTYTVSGGRARFLVVLYDLGGAPLALIEADHMGAFRTGAATGVAARRLTPPGPRTVAVIGTGWQAHTQVLALKTGLEIAELRVFGRDPERRARFAAEVGATPAASAEEAVRGADVVVTVTTSASPVLEAEWVAPGALVVAVGSNYPTRAELPPELVRGARAVVVDQLETARLESGDLLMAGYDLEAAIELGTVLAGRAAPPEGPAPLVVESHGLALWDLAAATTVLAAAQTAGLGEEVRLLPTGSVPGGP
jgi:ornithine cyclodeaminase/alanine dehydrogenase-like protein (mu-crystallin family)